MWEWTWHPHPEVWLLTAGLIAWYRFSLRRLGPSKVAAGEPVSTKGQRVAFHLGVLTMFVASDWPVHDLAEGSFYSMHMVQHLMLSMIAAPLLLVGTPSWLFKTIVPEPLLRVVRFFSRPFIALVVFNTMIVFTHWPNLVNAAVGNELAHFGTHSLLFFASMAMWMPVFSPVLDIPRLSYPGQMVYLFLQSLVPTVPASFLTFGDRPLYHVYEDFPRLWNVSALADQRTAGLIMKIVGGMILWGVIAVMFFRWSKMERTDGVDALSFRDVDRSLNRMELTNG